MLSSLTSIAFENKIDAKTKILYSFSTILDDYVLNYCSTYDSYTVNRLYSQKKILDEKFNSNKGLSSKDKISSVSSLCNIIFKITLLCFL